MSPAKTPKPETFVWTPLDFSKVPAQAAAHIAKRLDQRSIPISDRQRILAWSRTKPIVPNWYWYKDFGSFILVGEGPVPTSVLSKGMKPWGVRLSSLLLAKYPGSFPTQVLAGMANDPNSTRFKFGTVQAELPKDSQAYHAVEVVRDQIDPSDLDGKGIRVGRTHVTVRYGLQTDDTSEVERYLSELPPMEAVLGRTSSFPPSESSEDAAVLIAPVECPALYELNDRLADMGDFIEPAFEYRPHVTIAYVKPEAVDDYLGMKTTEGKKFTITEIAVVNSAEEHKVITLNGVTRKGVKTADGPTQDQDTMGKPGDITETPQFKAWFAGSKIVDDHGRPLRVFHGTAGTFDTFHPQGGLIFFTPDPDFAAEYAADKYEVAKLYGEEASTPLNVMPCYLRVAKPFDPRNKLERNLLVEWSATEPHESGFACYDAFEVPDVLRELHKRGYDGIWMKETDGNTFNTIAVFQPNQIKSAIGNNGVFDPKSNSITASAAPNPAQLVFKSRPADNGDGFEIAAYLDEEHAQTFDSEGSILVKQDDDGDYVVYRAGVDDRWRGTGLGQLLYDKAIQELRNEGAEVLWSDDDRTKDATAAWRRLGQRYPVSYDAHLGRFRLELREDPESEYAHTASADPNPVAIANEYMHFLKPGLPKPIIRVEDTLGKGWLGRCKWSPTDNPETTTIQLQKSIMGDEQTVRRVVAHEMCHHEDLLLNWATLTSRQQKLYARLRDGHGPSWQAIADRFNQALGSNFVTKTSDAAMVVEETGKEYFLLVRPSRYGKDSGFQFAWAARPSAQQRDRIKAEMEKGARLFRIGDRSFAEGPQIGKAWGSFPRGHELAEKLGNIWERREQAKLAAAKDSPDRFDKFMQALRAWGNNTRTNRAATEKALLKFTDVASKFTGAKGTLYRGDAIDEEELAILKAGETLTREVSGSLISFSRTRAGANIFAQNADTGEGVLYKKTGLKVFLDFTALAAHLKAIAYPLQTDEDDYTLTDPIKEQEVICYADGDLVIEQQDVVGVWTFHEAGDQVFIPAQRLKTAATTVTPPAEKTAPYTAPPAIAENPNFRAWFNGSKVVDTQGNPLRVYRGDYRGDKIGDTFKVNKSTSGRFYFTDDPDIASGYATGKPDSHHVEENQSYSDWFRFPDHKYKGERSIPNLIQAWYRLTPEEKKRVQHVVENTTRDDEGELKFDAGESIHPRVEDLARRAHGNWLQVAHEIWLESGSLFGEEQRFSEILDKAGIHHQYDNPHEARSMVTPVYLSIKHPLDTSAIPQDVLDWFHAVAKTDRTRPKSYGHDQWDKSTTTLKDWVQGVEEDIKNGTTYAWTTVPEKITKGLQAMGYDGIKDTGGKHTGEQHTVWIAFEPNQIKSATGNKGKFDPNKNSITARKRASLLTRVCRHKEANGPRPPGFDWDDDKAEENIRNHNLSFEEASKAFSDPHLVIKPDHAHSWDEERFIAIGYGPNHVLYIVHTYRGDDDEIIRLISARKADIQERKLYEESNKRSRG